MLEVWQMGAKERSENLAAEQFMTMRHHLHFAGASKRSHRTAQHSVTCPVGARNPAQRAGNVPAQDPVGHLSTYHTKDELRRRALPFIQKSVLFVLGVDYPSTS